VQAADSVDTTIDPLTLHVRSKCPSKPPTPQTKCHDPSEVCLYPGNCSGNAMMGAQAIRCEPNGTTSGTWGDFFCPGPN
jgi:hypothetical protein